MTQKNNWLLAAAVIMIFMTSIDGTAVNLILAPLGTQLHIPINKLQWVINVYILIYAALIAIGGRLGDTYGQKKIVTIGLIGFVTGSLITAAAHSLATIITGRIIQGIAAAMLSPNNMAMIYRIFPQEKKGMVTGIITSALGTGMTIGPFIGGLLTKLYSWRLVFFINLPLSICALIILLKFLHLKQPQQGSLRNIDLPGATILGLFLFSLVTALDLYNNLHLSAPLLIIAALLLVIFIYLERKAVNPIVGIELLQNKTIALSCVIRFLYGIPLMCLAFVFGLYLQHGLGYSPLKAGLMFLPLTTVMILLGPYVGRIVDKIGSFIPLILGIIISIIAYLGLAIPLFNRDLIALIICSALVGVGLGFIRPSLVTAIMKATPDNKLGVVTSIFNMVNNLGGSIGIVISAIILSFFTKLGNTAQMLQAMPFIMYFCVIILILTALLVYLGIRTVNKVS